jgi:excinuclease UvrABC nuclease subunit
LDNPAWEEEWKEAKDWMAKGWSGWFPLDEKNIRSIPKFPGVYEIRIKDYSFARLRGSSNTIYIGSVEKRDLRKRLNGLIKGRHVASRRIEKIKNELNTGLEFRYRVEFAARELEQELLHEYECEHLELPPCNHNISRQRV